MRKMTPAEKAYLKAFNKLYPTTPKPEDAMAHIADELQEEAARRKEDMWEENH